MFGGSAAGDGVGVTGAWLLEGEAAAGGTGTLHISLELVWHTAVSCSLPFAAAANDASVIELELRPVADADAGAGAAAAAAAAAAASPSSAQVAAAAQQSQRWHRIGRCAPSFLPAPVHDANLALAWQP